MCGICGIYAPGEAVDKNDIKIMMSELSHRGPDGNGIFIGDGIGLGHTRLAILDLSERGKQPMTDSTGRYTIVYNGEVYNYIELREELKKRGYRFNTDTDTEVVLYSWVEFGSDCDSLFNGMWAYAIYDSDGRRLIISRDKFGIKPLYYFSSDGMTIFASEVKALVKLYQKITGSALKINTFKIANFFANVKMENTADTYIKGIFKLPTGYILPKKVYHGDPIGSFVNLLNRSIDIRLRSDVEVGSCLSGGLDSSTIVSLLMKKDIDRLHTFSACYDDKSIDESLYITEITKNDKIIPHLIFPTIEMLQKDMDKLIYYQDEPFETTTILAQWCVMKEAKRQGIKVLLDGQGADEILAGYMRYKWLVSNDPKYRIRGLLWKNVKLRSVYRRYREWDVPNEIWQYVRYPVTKIEGSTNLERKLHEDVVQSLPRLLRYEDRNSMAFGIEARVPFLDHNLIDFCFSLGDSWKINNGWTKYVLRESMKGILPEKIRQRKDKIGFWTPHKLWMEQLKDEVDCAVDEFTLFNARPYFEKYYHGKRDYQYTLWKVYLLSKWIPMFTEGC